MLFALGVAAVAMSASIHLHLWMHGYSNIATIGPLFLLQAASGYALAVAIAVRRRPSVALLGVGYLLGTMAGFLLSVNVGLFGFQDTWSASLATTSFAAEASGVVLLLAAAASSIAGGDRRHRHTPPFDRMQRRAFTPTHAPRR